MNILMIHGVNTNEDSNPSPYAAWQTAINQGLTGAGVTAATINDDPATNGVDYNSIFDAHDDNPGLYAVAAAELLLTAAWHAVTGPARETAYAQPPPEQPGPGIPSEIRWSAGMVAQWVVESGLRSDCRNLLVNEINSIKPDVIFAHSLGTLICYDLLVNDARGADLFGNGILITFGSQIANPFVQDRMWSGEVEMVNVKRWYNLYNPNDPVFVAPINVAAANFQQFTINPPFGNSVLDVTAHQVTSNGVHPGYLDNATTAANLWPLLAGGSMAALIERNIRIMKRVPKTVAALTPASPAAMGRVTVPAMAQGRRSVLTIRGSHRVRVPDATYLSDCDPEQVIKLSIYARRNTRPSTKTLTSIEKLQSQLPGKRRYLTNAEFDDVFGASQADLKTISAWAERSNLKVLETNVSKRRVLVEGKIREVSISFGVVLSEYDHPTLGRFRGREGALHVPEEVYGVIDGVFGLDTRPVGHSRRCRGRFAPVDAGRLKLTAEHRTLTMADPSTQWPGTFFPPQVAELYDYPANLDGTGQNIAVFAFNGPPGPDTHGGYNIEALQNYFQQTLGMGMPEIEDVVIQGAGNNPGADTDASANNGDSTGEVMLDMCVVGSVAPGAKMFIYFTEFTTQGWVDAINDAVAGSNDISVISISYGNPEQDPNSLWSGMDVNAVNQAFEAATAKGITVCCASGDDGSSDGGTQGSEAEVDFPASSPYVLGVGGTKLTAASLAPPKIKSEVVWNEELRQEGAGGGGVSALFSKPSYQDGVNVPPSVNPPHNVGRGVPDVAADADPESGVVVMNVDGVNLEPIGGTSAATPLWAALVARLNQGLNTRCGFLNEVLYTMFPKGVFHDITEGNNGSYQAQPGWDACTGLGTPDGAALLKALGGGNGDGSARSRSRVAHLMQ